MSIAVVLALFGVCCAQPVPVGPVIDARAVYLPDLPEYPENNLLTGAEKLFTGNITGPEAFAKDPLNENVMYSGLADGRIVKFVRTEGSDDLTLENFVRTGEDLPNCGDIAVEPQCGRPLGIHFDETGDNLLVIDAYQGLLSFSRDGTKTLLTDRVTDESVPFVLVNSLIVDEDTGDIYFTESSRRWTRRLIVYEALEGTKTGRLNKYTKATGITETLVDNIRLANGLTFSHDKKYIYVNQLGDAKIGRYTLPRSRNDDELLDEEKPSHLLGDQQSRRRRRWDPNWMTNVPGILDNIVPRTSERTDGQKTYFVGCGQRRAAGYSFFDTIAPHPDVKRDFARYIPAIDMVLDLFGLYGNIIEINDDAEIVQTLQDPTGGVAWLSEAFEFGDHLYLGTWLFPWLARVPRDVYD